MDITIIGAVYCILIITIGQFFLLNLILAVIIQAFIKIQKRAYEERFIEMNKQTSITQIQPEKHGALGRMITLMQQKGIEDQSVGAAMGVDYLSVEPKQMPKSYEKSKTSLSDNATPVGKKRKHKKVDKQESDLFKDRQ